MPRKRINNKKVTLPVLNPDAAGIDIGATEIYVAVPPDRDAESIRRFATFTQDLTGLVDWLQRCGIRTVAMESTGVYWIPLMQMLDARGFEAYLVNAKHVKNVPVERRTYPIANGCSISIRSDCCVHPSVRPKKFALFARFHAIETASSKWRLVTFNTYRRLWIK
jgi:hypothetical protein